MNELTIRFSEVYNYLLSEKLVKGQSDFSEMIGISNSAMTEILKGRTNAGIKPIQNTVNVFPIINSEWLLTGKGQKLLPTNSSENFVINEPEYFYGKTFKEIENNYTESLIELIFNSDSFKEKMKEMIQKEIPKSEADRDLKLISELELLIKNKLITK